MSLPRYPDYKHSGVDWLGEVPSHWKIERLKNVISLRKITVGDTKSDYTLLSLTLQGVVARDMVNPKGKFPAEFDTYQVVEKDDLVFCLFDVEETPRAVGISPCTGMVTGAYTVGRVKVGTSAKYFYNFYLSRDQYKALKMYYTGLRNVIRPETFSAIPCPVPPINEQIRISNFLENETVKIDTLIVQQEKLIELLKEKRQSVISHTVSKGLNTQIKMKESGVEWLDQIPEHWVVKKIKFVAYVMASNVDKKTYEGDIPCLLCNYTDVYYNDQIIKDMEFMSATATPEQISKFTLKKGDVIITKDSESPDDIAIAAHVPMDLTGVVCGYHLSIIRAFDINGMFVKRLFDSHYLKSKFATLANGLTRYGLGQHSINNAYIPIPPKEEQQQIVDFINKTCIGIDDLIDKTKTSMNLLIERRSALISAAVTGQIDVRNYELKEIE